MPTFPDALAHHLERLRLAGRTPTTITQRRNTLRRYARHLPCDPLRATPADLDRWQTTTLAGLSPVTRACDVGHVSRFYRWCVGEGILTPANGARLESRLIRPSLPRRLPRPIAEDTLDMLVLDAPDRLRPWFVLAGWAGLRAGEVARATRVDVQDQAESPVMRVHGKGGKERIVPLSPFVLAELHRHGLPTRGPLFRRPSDGRQESPQRVSQLANIYMREQGVTDNTFHGLRHRFATALYDSCGDLRVVQEVLGHATPAITALYVQWSNGKAVDGVGKIRTPT